MALDTLQEPVSDQLLIASPGEAPPCSFHAEELDIIAFDLWWRGSSWDSIGDECSFCKGEAQRCLVCQ
jgi:hypothetical protein